MQATVQKGQWPQNGPGRIRAAFKIDCCHNLTGCSHSLDGAVSWGSGDGRRGGRERRGSAGRGAERWGFRRRTQLGRGEGGTEGVGAATAMGRCYCFALLRSLVPFASWLSRAPRLASRSVQLPARRHACCCVSSNCVSFHDAIDINYRLPLSRPSLALAASASCWSAFSLLLRSGAR